MRRATWGRTRRPSPAARDTRAPSSNLRLPAAALTKSRGPLQFDRRSQLYAASLHDARGGVVLMGERIPIPGTEIEVPLGLDLSRRDLLKIAGYGSLAAFIAAC